MGKKEWREPEVRKIKAGSAEFGTLAGSDPDPGSDPNEAS